MDKLIGVLFVVLIIVNLYLYHKVVKVYYFDLGRGLLNEVIGAGFVAGIEIVLIALLFSVLAKIFGTVFGIAFKIIVVLAIIVVGYFVGKKILSFVSGFKKEDKKQLDKEVENKSQNNQNYNYEKDASIAIKTEEHCSDEIENNSSNRMDEINKRAEELLRKNRGLKVKTIKQLREEFGLELRKAKEIIDLVSVQENIVEQSDSSEEIKVIENDKIFCIYCGKKISKSAKFCQFCGEKNTYYEEKMN